MLTALLLFFGAALAQEPAPAEAPPRPTADYVLPPGPEGTLDADRLAALLSAYVRIDTRVAGTTESFQVVDGRQQWVDFLVGNWAEPLGLSWEVLDGNFVMRVPGADPGPPILWLSHTDVVPVDPRDLDDWTHPPLEGVIDGGVVFGRGTLDNKGSTVMQLEALRVLLEGGGQPSRSVVFVVTPDEEANNARGARALAERHLEALGGPTAVLDEGGYILPDFFEGMMVATVAVAEKTYVTVELSVKGEGGHASMPREGNPTGVLVEALARVEGWETRQLIRPEMKESLKRLGGAESFPTSFVMRHPGLFRRVLIGSLGATPAGNAVTRNTVAITILDAGVKDNVIPGEAVATLNARLLPEVAVADFLAELEEVVGDERVQIRLVNEPVTPSVAPYDTQAFAAIEAAIHSNMPEAVVIPNLNPGTQDARFFAAAGLDCYRFIPVVVDTAGRSSIHGNDEKLAVSELERGASIYLELLMLQ